MILTSEDCVVLFEGIKLREKVNGHYLSSQLHCNMLLAMNINMSCIDVFTVHEKPIKMTQRISVSLQHGLSDIVVAHTCNFEKIVAFVDNDTRQLQYYQIDLNNNLINKTCVSLNFNDKVHTILFQDGFFYLLCNNQNNSSTNIIVLRPDFEFFGKLSCANYMEQALMVGKDIYYLADGNIETFDLLKKERHIVHRGKISSFTMNEKSIFLYDNNRFIELSRSDLSQSLVSDFDLSIVASCKHMTSSEFGNDFRHSLSAMTECVVRTFFAPQLDRNLKSILDILCELSINIFSSPKNFKAVEDIHTGIINFNNFRDINKQIIFGKDVYDIVNPPSQMFEKYYNYQFILKDMESIFNMKDTKRKMAYNKFLKAKGIDINYSYYMSGQYHLFHPMHAKGWHNNIESVPKKQSDVVYFVATNQNEYGGSFFLYRHPYSKAIHAVPDIHGTMKQFFLQSSHKNPLWHAIGSFTATRLSIGYSKRSDQEISRRTGEI